MQLCGKYMQSFESSIYILISFVHCYYKETIEGAIFMRVRKNLTSNSNFFRVLISQRNNEGSE